MATISVVATVEANNVPPRVRLAITDSGTPANNAVTVTRTDPAGNVATVRTTDAEPLPLLTSGSTRVATLYDYLMPYGVPVAYSTAEQPAVTATVTVDESRIWLVHPGVPSWSVPIDLMKGSLDEEEEDVTAGVFFPLGRRNALVITDGVRKAPSGTLIVGTLTPTDRAALKQVLSDACPLLLNVPPLTGLDIDTEFLHIGRLRRARPSDVGTDPHRNWVMPFQVVDPPEGGSQAQWTWGDVIDQYATWADLMAAQPTWAHVMSPTS